MQSSLMLALVAIFTAVCAGPIVAPRANTPPSYGPPVYGPPPPVYGQSTTIVPTGQLTVTLSSTSTVIVSPIAQTSSSNEASPAGASNTTTGPLPTTTTITYTIPFSSSNSSLASPIGATNISSIPQPSLATTFSFTIPYPSSNSSLGSPIGATSTPSSFLPTGFSTPSSVPLSTGGSSTLSPEQPSSTSYVTITVTIPPPSPSSSLPSGMPIGSTNYTMPYSTGSSEVSPITATAPTSGAASTGAIPTNTNSTSTSTDTMTSFFTFTLSPTGLSTVSGNSSGSFPVSPITASLNSSSSFFYPTGTGSFPVSPITASLNLSSSFFVNPTGISTSYRYDLSTGISSSSGSSIASPVTASGNSSTSSLYLTGGPTATTTIYAPAPFPTDSPGGYTPTGTGGSSEDSPVGASTSSIPFPTFTSQSRFPGTGSSTLTSTLTVTNLETFPTILPDSTTYSSGSATADPVAGSSTITAAPSGTGVPVPYPSTAYGYAGYGAPPAYGVYKG